MNNEVQSRIERLLLRDPGTPNFAYPNTSLWREIDRDTIIGAWDDVPNSTDRIPMTVYVGVEGCPTRCTFCGYGAAMRGTDSSVQRGVDSIIDDIGAYRDVDWARFVVRSIFIGGGTPNILSKEQLEKIMTELEFLPYADDIEIGTEIYPQEVLEHKGFQPRDTKEFLRTFRGLGGNRINWAVQDFDERVLQASGRHYSIQEALNLYREIERLSFEYVNIDLLLGTRGHRDYGIEGMREGLVDLLTHGKIPNRISANILSLAYRRILDRKIMRDDGTLVGLDKLYSWSLAIGDILEEVGLGQINRFDYGEESQYETDVITSIPRLAFGTGAIGYVPLEKGGLAFKNPIVRDTRKLRGYVLDPIMVAAQAIHNKVFTGEVDDIGTKQWDVFVNALSNAGLVISKNGKVKLTRIGKFHHATVQNILTEAVLGYPNNLGKRVEE